MIVALVSTAGVILAAALGLFGVWMSDRTAMKKLVVSANQQLVDNLQEERQSIKRDLEQLKRQVAVLLLQGRYKDDYINQLRAHIEDGKPPPPPAYPQGLLRIEGL